MTMRRRSRIFLAVMALLGASTVLAESLSPEFDAELDTLNKLRQEYPHDVDYALARAQLLARHGRDHEALDDLRDARLLAPDYEDVWRVQFRLLSRQQDESAQLERETLLRKAAIRFPHASWWRTEKSNPVASWTLLAGAGHEDLSNGLPSWNQQFIEVSREQDSLGRHRLGIARDERFGKSDLSVLLGRDLSFAADWSAGLDAALAGDADFQPRLSVSAYIGRTLPDGWLVNLRYRHRSYETATVGSAISTVEKYAGDFRFAYALGLSQLQGSSSSTHHGLTVNWYYSDRSSIGVTVNTGEEAEAIGPGQVLKTDVRGMSISGRRKLTDRFGLQWWLGLHDQGNIYRRLYLGLAVSIRL